MSSLVLQVTPRASGLTADALPRVDWSDAFSVDCLPGAPQDPQVWVEALFRDPPTWVRVLLGVREALVGLVGIQRAGGRAFVTQRCSAHEVLVGIDQRHLDFRALVQRQPSRVVITTLVQVHNRRGRAYSVLVRRIHPHVVRTMLARASERLDAAA